MMKTQWMTRLAALLAVTVFGTIGCASSGSKLAPDPAGSPTAKMEAPEPPATARTGPAPTLSLPGAIYFDTDRSELREDARKTLRTSATKILENPDRAMLTVEGHCDERGSDEYNLALGERRAAKVKRYLEDLGVEGERLQTVSYGESKPAARGHDESSWKQNRRSEIEVGIHHASTR
jgi:peptidoglycan-associated lipoprotein